MTDESGEHLVHQEGQVQKYRTVRRVKAEDRWDGEEIKRITAVPSRNKKEEDSRSKDAVPKGLTLAEQAAAKGTKNNQKEALKSDG